MSKISICPECFGEMFDGSCGECGNERTRTTKKKNKLVGKEAREAYFDSLSDKKTFPPHLKGKTWNEEPSKYKYYPEGELA